MKTYQGSCHCGAVKFSIDCKPINKGLRCTCSICRRKGTLMSSEALDKDQIRITANPEDIGLYQFDSKKAHHYFCKHCGIYTHHETARYPGKYRVNLGCIDEVDTFALDFDVFDGRNWMPD
ncbi:MAG: GFA family protein [Gammaproteobacteria bacterium]|nr:GFA family protein [Gammaproteobacteria bacterium]MDH5778787.1 GFA family protein [Gammaproteobacteria bacterium]